MLKLDWVEQEIDRVKAGTCTMQSVRDYALLCIARDNLRENTPKDKAEGLEETPTIDQVERALGSVVVNSDAERKRVRDAMTWAKIIIDG